MNTYTRNAQVHVAQSFATDGAKIRSRSCSGIPVPAALDPHPDLSRCRADYSYGRTDISTCGIGGTHHRIYRDLLQLDATPPIYGGPSCKTNMTIRVLAFA